MKKLSTFVLTCTLITTMPVIASAGITKDSQLSGNTFVADGSGFEIDLPEEYTQAKGMIDLYDYGDSHDRGDGVVSMYASYYPMAEPEYQKLSDEEGQAESEGDMDKAQELLNQLSGGTLFFIYGINEDRNEEDLKEIHIKNGTWEGMSQEEIDEMTEHVRNSQFLEIGSFEGFTYYLDMLEVDEEEIEHAFSDFDESFREEFLSLKRNPDLILDNIRLTGGVELSQPIELANEGDIIHFETKDLNGNPVSSEDLFAGHAVTMINMWATWCGPCKKELPELEELNKELADKNCQIIGLVTDAESEELIDKAAGILEERGVTYVNITPFEGIEEMLPISTYPTTYFVDETGTVVGEPLIGAYLDKYPERIDDILESMN